jgi:flagellar basal body-associated protein FliL
MRRARQYPRRGRLWTLIVVVAVILLTAGVAFVALQTRRAIATTQDSRSDRPFIASLN